MKTPDAISARTILLIIVTAVVLCGCGEKIEIVERPAPNPVERENPNQYDNDEPLDARLERPFNEIKNADKDVIAVVLGKPIAAKEKDQLNGRIFGALLDQYAKENQIEPTENEIQAFLLKNKPPAGPDGHGPIEDDEEMRHVMRDMAHQFVRTWKINRSLHKKYGGRIIFQQAGAEPIDAYRDFVKEQEKKGNFQIHDKSDEAFFWKYFTDDSMHTFHEEADGAKFMETPWWLMDPPDEE